MSFEKSESGVLSRLHFLLPVRIRLTLGFILAFGALLVALEAIDERALRTLQERMVREVLAEKLAEVKDTIQSESEIYHLPEELSLDGAFVEVVGPDGRILSRSENLGDAYLPGNPIRIRPPAGMVQLDEPVMTGTASLAIPGGQKYRAVVGVPLDAIEEVRQQKRVSGTFAVSLGLLGTALIGYVFSGTALRPIERLRREVEKIEAEDIQRRIDLSRLPADEIGRVARTFNDLLDRVAAAREKQQRFIEDASHDLRSPITIIAGQAQLLLKRHKQDPSLIESGLRGILREAERLRRLVDDLLVLAHSSTAALVPSGAIAGEADVASIAAEMVAVRREVNPQIRLGTLEPAPTLAAPDHVRRILANLLDNAIRAVSTDGRVEVEVERREPHVRLTVRDDGIGIPPEEIPRVFDRFYRVDPVRDREGSGLGLSVVQALARAYGGDVRLQSAPGVGTEVHVDLPLAGDPARGRGRGAC